MLHNRSDYARQINDDNIDCGMILITGCDPFIHEYVSPIDLISSVLDDLGRPSIDRCDMVADIPGAGAGALLRVDNTGNCVEFVNPNTVFSAYNTDEMVSVAGSDTPGYLINKIMSSDNSISIANVGGKLDITSSAVTSFLDLSDTPSTYSGHTGKVLKVSGSGLVFADDDRGQRAVRYLVDDQVITNVPSNVDGWVSLETTYFEGSSALEGTFNNERAIEVKKTGMYNVWMNCGVHINSGVNAMKACVITSEEGNKKILLNAKTGTSPSGHPLVMTQLGETHRFVAFSEHGLVKLTAGTKLHMMVRVSSHAGNNVAPEVIIEGKSLTVGHPGSTNEQNAHTYCGSSFGVSWHSDITHNAQ